MSTPSPITLTYNRFAEPDFLCVGALVLGSLTLLHFGGELAVLLTLMLAFLGVRKGCGRAPILRLFAATGALLALDSLSLGGLVFTLVVAVVAIQVRRHHRHRWMFSR